MKRFIQISIYMYLFFCIVNIQKINAELIALKADLTENCNHSLKIAKKNNIPYQCIKQYDQSLPIPLWQHKINFKFGRLKKNHFQILKKYYELWNTNKELKYKKNNIYWLTDFLPLTLKKLEGHRFIPEKIEVNSILWNFMDSPVPNNQDYQASIYANCWGITYEILRDPINPIIFYAKSDFILEIFKDKTRLIQENIDQPKPGDILFIYHIYENTIYLDHTAILIDNGIYFEKAGSGEFTPIRLVDEETLFKTWRPDVFTYEWRRTKDRSEWPLPKDIFSLSSNKMKNLFPKLEYLNIDLNEEITADWYTDDDGIKHASFFLMKEIN